MMFKQYVAYYVLIFFLSVAITSHAQEKADKKSLKIVLQDTISTYSQSDLFSFPNVNNTYYFRDERKAKKISQLNKSKQWEELYQELRPYVAQFGIVNFYKETYWLWRLAKLTEVYGNYDEARLLYKLVLKHHRSDIDIRSVELYYDSLTKNDQDYYVPLEYYYELVDYRKEVDTLRPPRSVLLNMGQSVNSKWSDYGPTLNNDDDLMIFTSQRNNHYSSIGDRHDEDLFYSKRENETWNDAVEFSGINSSYNEGSACLSKDKKTLFFARCNSPDSYGDCDIYTSTLQPDSTWSKVKNLGTMVNSKAWDSHPSLSHTEDTLYFASDRLGGFGLSDIYFTVKDNRGNWQKAQNAGPIINTRNSEVSPFFHHAFDVLYFSSNGQNLNFGEFDIYKCYRTDGNWLEPKNIGPLVNGPGSEFYFTIDSRSADLFYARSVENNITNMDLYSFPVPMAAQPLARTKVTGTLTNEENGKPFKGIVSIIDLDNGIEIAPKFLRPDGSFEFDLINHNNYLLIIQGDEFFRIEELFYLDGDLNLHKTTPPISHRIEFTSIEFDNGRSELKKEMYGDLDKIADFLLDNPSFGLNISGHTDSDGRETFNLKLSQDRADAIKEYLVYFGGVPEKKINAKGYGSSKPLVSENSDEDKTLNRRVEFELIRDGETRLVKNP
ncbi:MAG: OmpA family protein [Cyclobacteriaceae bacterium]|nr:OmpA family protein [Cyclobacteriaceae bacterium]